MIDTAQLEKQLTTELGLILDKPVSAEDDLVEAGLDSFATMQIVAFLEDGFGIEVPEERLPVENFENAKVIVAWVSAMLEGAS